MINECGLFNTPTVLHEALVQAQLAGLYSCLISLVVYFSYICHSLLPRDFPAVIWAVTISAGIQYHSDTVKSLSHHPAGVSLKFDCLSTFSKLLLLLRGPLPLQPSAESLQISQLHQFIIQL